VRSVRRLLPLLLVVACVVAAPGATATPTEERSIAFVTVIEDVTDLTEAAAAAGWWLPAFDLPAAVTGAPTSAGAVDALPAWIEPFNHTTSPVDPGCLELGCSPTYLFRTFSQDGPARASGGIEGWAELCLPDGRCGVTGAIVDPHTYADGEPNNNNTINRIQLTGEVPSRFHVAVLVDSTALAHDGSRVELRGNAGRLDVPQEVAATQVESTGSIELPEPNGTADLVVFEVTGFVAGDYLKLRLRGTTSPASFGGLLFAVA
jgi:hypothetical protein